MKSDVTLKVRDSGLTTVEYPSNKLREQLICAIETNVKGIMTSLFLCYLYVILQIAYLCVSTLGCFLGMWYDD
jgi:hypothetical protein